VFRVIHTKDTVAKEVEDEEDDNLVDQLSKDHLDHVNSEKPRAAGIRFPV